MNETKKCPYCGEEIMATAKKCRHCGEWLDGSVSQSSESVKKTTKIGLKIKTILIGVAFIAIVAIVVITIRTMGSSDRTECNEIAEEQLATTEDYTIRQVSFDPKSLVALNLMSRKDAEDILRSSGWESAMEVSEEDQKGKSKKVADGYVKDFNEENLIYEYIPNRPTSQNGEGSIEFETYSSEVHDQWELSLKNDGYHFRTRRRPSDERLETICKNDSIANAPEIVLLYNSNGMTESGASCVMYINKFPSNTKK